MFRGTHIVKLDGKGRIVIPSRYREVLEADGQGMVVTGHPDRYLLLMFRKAYEELERRVSDMPDNGQHALYYKQTLIGKADDSISFDKAGRIGLAPDLREHATLTGEVAVVGMREHLRLWSKEKLDSLASECQIRAVRAGGQLGAPDGWESFRI